MAAAANMFSVRLVTADYYMASPLRGLDVCQAPRSQAPVRSVPVVRVFGATPAGERARAGAGGAPEPPSPPRTPRPALRRLLAAAAAPSFRRVTEAPAWVRADAASPPAGRRRAPGVAPRAGAAGPAAGGERAPPPAEGGPAAAREPAAPAPVPGRAWGAGGRRPSRRALRCPAERRRSRERGGAPGCRPGFGRRGRGTWATAWAPRSAGAGLWGRRPGPAGGRCRRDGRPPPGRALACGWSRSPLPGGRPPAAAGLWAQPHSGRAVTF